MQPLYPNSLSISPYSKEIPYSSSKVTRNDGEINHGFKNLIAHPELVDIIPELASDQALKSLVCALNFGHTQFFTTGCFSSQVKEEDGYRYSGYLEFAWNCQICVRDAINYFSLFFHFEQFLRDHRVKQSVSFQWLLEEAQFLDVEIAGFCCAIFINTVCCSSSHQAYADWQGSLSMLESFLCTIPMQSSRVIY
ncbi:hypothetical protein ACKFKG_14270 [Phormidesmis sp. 146-35]